MQCFSAFSIPPTTKLIWQETQWILPKRGEVKFNTDGSSLRKPEPGGIRGLLRNHIGDILIKFSKSVGVVDSNCAEIMAIREALMLYLTTPWANESCLIIERFIERC
ncbi:hypothetical protein PTKIN_Ptkin10aG0040400 [Pterospermum kingtungense]